MPPPTTTQLAVVGHAMALRNVVPGGGGTSVQDQPPSELAEITPDGDPSPGVPYPTSKHRVGVGQAPPREGSCGDSATHPGRSTVRGGHDAELLPSARVSHDGFFRPFDDAVAKGGTRYERRFRLAIWQRQRIPLRPGRIGCERVFSCVTPVGRLDTVFHV